MLKGMLVCPSAAVHMCVCLPPDPRVRVPPEVGKCVLFLAGLLLTFDLTSDITRHLVKGNNYKGIPIQSRVRQRKGHSPLSFTHLPLDPLFLNLPLNPLVLVNRPDLLFSRSTLLMLPFIHLSTLISHFE
jgi:hypothetical protein